ncbi:MAG TPA: hypothetical protein ENH98_04490 [archaeon]|nr:hypothetical protein [archaeon]
MRLVDQVTENKQNILTNSKNYDNFREDLEKAYYKAISEKLKSLKVQHPISSLYNDDFEKSKEDVSQLLRYSDKLGIFIDASNIDVKGIISELHIDGLNNGLRDRIIQLVRFFNKYNLFERNFTADELKIIQEIKEEHKLLAVNLKDLFGTVSDALLFYVCKIMPYDYLKWIRDMLKNPRNHRFLMRPKQLENWTDYFPIYGLIIRNLGSVEDFIKAVETMQNLDNTKEDIIKLEFNPRYIITVNEDHIIREFREIHLIHPKNVLKNKEKILNKDNYKFYSLSMLIFGGLGPQGYGLTYSTPKGEVIEICSDQRETEAIIVQFKQYLKKRFLSKLEKEMKGLDIDFDIRENIINYLSDVINPKNLISYYDKNSILRKIRNLLTQYDGLQNENKFKIEEILEKISSAISIIFKDVKLEDQFRTRMDLVSNGRLKSEDIAKLTSLRGKSHYDVLRERMFLQNKPYWFFKNYPEEIEELEEEFYRVAEREGLGSRSNDF